MLIRFWGARGSTPVSGRQYLKYGGDTACVEVRTPGGEVIVVDAGTGIRRLGKLLASEKVSSCSMLFTHSHWDHIMGFPFFQPIYRKDFKLRIIGCPLSRTSVREMVAKIMEPPNFPVKFEAVSASISFNPFCENNLEIDGVTITPVFLNHPNGGTGFKFTEKGRSFVFLTDNELDFHHPDGLGFEQYANFCRGADILVHDAEFTAEEYASRISWGHSTFDRAFDLARAAEVKCLGLYHHNQDRSDDELDRRVEELNARAAREGLALQVFAVSPELEMRI